MTLKSMSSCPLRMPSWKKLIVKLAPAAYRPERYYMRGPGPEYREKHARHCFDLAAPLGRTE